MNHKTTFTSINVFKDLLFKLVPLSVAMLLTSTAYADCPDPGVLNNYVRNGAFVRDAANTDWKLRQGAPFSKFVNPEFKLVSIKAEKLFDHAYDPRMKSVECEYKDPYQADSVFLSTQVNGKLNTVSVTYPNYNTTVGYILNTGSLKTNWDDWKPTSESTVYKCTVLPSDQKKECGGFNFTDHREGEQRNWYWEDAANWCRGWVKCTGWNWYKYKTGYKNYILEMALLHNTPVGNPKFEYWYSEGVLPAKPFCVDAKCTNEIAAMNKIVGGELGGDQGLAKYLNMCWRNLDWTNKKVADGQGCSTPTTPWPDYSALDPLPS